MNRLAAGGGSKYVAILALVLVFSFTPMSAHAATGFWSGFWCGITGMFGFECVEDSGTTQEPIQVVETKVSTTLPPSPEEAHQYTASSTPDGRVVYTTIVEEHNHYTTNPTTIVREYRSSGGGGGSSDGVSMELFRKQVERIYESMGDAADGVQEDLDEALTGFASSVSTALLSVSGNADVGGDLNVVGTLTAGSLSVSSLSSGSAIEAPYLSATSTTATSTFSGALSLVGTALLGSAASSDNFIVNAVDNRIESGTIVNTISGGGRSTFPNLIGFPIKPLGTDYTPTGWANDTGYVSGEASVSTISGGYDHVNNQIAGVIAGGGHNFIKYNSVGHSVISGGSYNLISGGRSVIAGGQRNTITGTNSIGSAVSGGINNNIIGSYSTIAGGLDNTITGDYSFIPGGRLNVVSGDWALAFGRRAQANATGTIALADSTNADFTVGTQNVFASRFSAGYWLTGGNVGIGTTSPNGKLSVYTASAGSYTPSTAADELVLENSGSGGMTIVTPDSSTGQIFFGSPSRQVGAQIGWRQSTGIFTLGSGNGGAQVQILSGNSVEAVRIDSGGKVGVGTTTPSGRLSLTQSANTAAGGFWIAENGNTDYRSMFMNTSGVLSFNGGDTAGTLNTATLNAAGEWTNASDIAYKENVENISYGLDAVLALQPRSYDIKNTNDHRIGFIAQEVEEVIPEVVGGAEGSKGISYGNLVAVVVKAVQELSATISGFADIFRTNRVETNTLCVGQTCITENELIELLDEADQQQHQKIYVN